jgi:alkaline phosphatase
VKQSAASLSAHLLAYARTAPDPSIDEVKRYIREEILIKGAAFTDENRGLPQDGDVDRLFTCLRTTPDSSLDDPPINIADDCRNIIADLISRRAQVGWSTSGHTGVDVPVHVLGNSRLKGNMENTDVSNLAKFQCSSADSKRQIGQFIAKTLSIDLAQLTRKLRKKQLE